MIGRPVDPAFSLDIPWSLLHGARDNRRYRPGPGRLRLNPEYREAKKSLEIFAQLHARQAFGLPHDPLEGPVIVVARMYPPDRRKVDVLAFAKILLDALEGTAYLDDYQVAATYWTRREVDHSRPRIEVRIRPIGKEKLDLCDLQT